jgi:mxaA protein
VKRLFITACVLLWPALPAAAGADAAEVSVTLRETGYMLGDLLDERIEVRLPPTMRIDPDSLPLPGRVTPWLEVRRAGLVSQASGVQEIVVTYQIFAEAEQATRAPLPPFGLRARAGNDVRTVNVPAQTFLLSPALPPTLADRDRELRPSPEPRPLPLTAWVGSFASLVLALVCAGYLLWRYDRLPFLPYAPGPLLRTWRRWRRCAKKALSPGEHAALLRDLHAALSRSAGETLYPSTLEHLFVRAPHLAPLRGEIESVFAASWNLFYGAPEKSSPTVSSALDLLRSAADRERRVPC